MSQKPVGGGTMSTVWKSAAVCVLFVMGARGQGIGGYASSSVLLRSPAPATDSSVFIEPMRFYNVWGLDILISNDGFGLGAFYRREFSQDVFGFASFSISESKDEREVERFDIFGQSYSPGKLNRFLVMPLLFGIQYRLFRDDILENFRPYINAGAGPAMIFSAPFTEVSGTPPNLEYRQIDFFKSLGHGQAHYTASSFIGFGANFGSEKSSVFGVNFRYYFTYLFSDGLASLYDSRTGQVASTKTSFGGFFITLNVGMAY